ncbi:MAG TPA: HemK2/MTQ2 family protein methyltransferase [Candidatus Nanoarchaeia archaeon]|nr:HemK2/MTQ2 family protein methyltransferase [Candidatus Nanoarchaeia archaeon]
MIYDPREDSFLIEKEILKLNLLNKSFLDMGCGSGILGKAALKAGAKKVLFADINKEAVLMLKKEKLNAIETNLFSKIKSKFDFISFNPPYLPEDRRESSESALATTGGKRGDEILLRFMQQVKPHLKKDGQILLLLSSLTPMNKFNSLCKKQGFTVEKIASEKFDFEEIFVLLLKN